jgi:6,7-dimethyl-8-ribityllumazine synthase
MMRTDTTPAGVLRDATGFRFAVIVSRFNEGITGALRAGALEALSSARASRVDTFDVPGAFELPLAARVAAAGGTYDAVICLGCVIRGETPHFEYISSAVAHAIANVALVTGRPVTFGVLTTNTLAQAEARAASGPGNKGYEAAAAAIEMVHLLRRVPAPTPAPGIEA